MKGTIVKRRSGRRAREKRPVPSRKLRSDPLYAYSIEELLDGRVHQRRWTSHHICTYDTILAGLGWDDGKVLPRHGWVFDFRPEIHVREQVIIPDFAGWRANRRVQPLWDEPECDYSERGYTDSPDWICDIVEPSNVGLVRKTKKPLYHRLGVSWLWLVDRIESTIEVYSAGDADWQLEGAFGGNGILRTAPFKRVEINLDGLWEPI
jgi:hypothetical protein